MDQIGQWNQTKGSIYNSSRREGMTRAFEQVEARFL
jgi:hypothetical protein